ncbi:MAG: hypothetical protein ACK4K1_02465 [Flavobacterium sp.]
MKKLILLGALAFGGWHLFVKNINSSSAQNNPNQNPLAAYEGKIIVDNKGYWLLVENGLLYFVSQNMINVWLQNNPNQSALEVPTMDAFSQFPDLLRDNHPNR